MLGCNVNSRIHARFACLAPQSPEFLLPPNAQILPLCFDNDMNCSPRKPFALITIQIALPCTLSPTPRLLFSATYELPQEAREASERQKRLPPLEDRGKPKAATITATATPSPVSLVAGRTRTARLANGGSLAALGMTDCTFGMTNGARETGAATAKAARLGRPPLQRPLTGYPAHLYTWCLSLALEE